MGKFYRCDACSKETWILVFIPYDGKVIELCDRCYKEFRKNKEEIEKLYASA